MAQRTIVQLTDDLDGKPIRDGKGETIRFGLDRRAVHGGFRIKRGRGQRDGCVRVRRSDGERDGRVRIDFLLGFLGHLSQCVP